MKKAKKKIKHTGHRISGRNETGAIRKKWENRPRIALVYPNTYSVGMANLGFQTVYGLFNDMETVVCERAFLPEPGVFTHRLTSIESGRGLVEFDIIAFSISFENDFPNLPAVLNASHLPILSRDRNSSQPLVIAGGVAVMLNPEPVAPFIDCFLIGEAEPMVPEFIEALNETGYGHGSKRNETLKFLAQNVQGVYVPRFFLPRFDKKERFAGYDITNGVPPKIIRRRSKDLSGHHAVTKVFSPDTVFGDSALIEIGRGCPHGCRFCAAGYIYRPPRFGNKQKVGESIRQCMKKTKNIGLVGAAVSDFPDLLNVCRSFSEEDVRFSFSSLRADAIGPELGDVLVDSRVKTATFAPEAGSKRLRKVINKGITEEDILSATGLLVAKGVPNLKLYFMIGLPTETDEDIDAIVSMCRKIKEEFLAASKLRKKIGSITISINPFVPKPFTPFQWSAMDGISVWKKKIQAVRKDLKHVANMNIIAESPKKALIQGLFSRGDRRFAELVGTEKKLDEKFVRNHSVFRNWINDFISAERSLDAPLPWDIIDNGVDKSFLAKEYQKALDMKVSPPCPMKTCRICGVCSEEAGLSEGSGNIGSAGIL